MPKIEQTRFVKKPDETKSDTWLDRLEAQLRDIDNDLPPNSAVQTTPLSNTNTVAHSGDTQSITALSTPASEPLEEILEGKEVATSDGALVDQLVKRSNRVIISISTGGLCPNTITVEESKVTFIFRQIFTSQSHSVDIKDISNVFIESSLFAASIEIVSKTYVQNDTKITNLNKKKALKVRMIIEGLRTLTAYNIDTSNYTVPELLVKIEAMHASQTAGQMI